MTQWKLRRRGRMVGPLPTSELLRALQLGKVPIDSEAQRVGDDEWAPLAEFSEFAEEIARDTPTHIMSSPWFLDPSPPREHTTASDTDPTEILLESTPLPVPAALRANLPIEPMPILIPGISPRGPMATVPDASPPADFQFEPDPAERAPGFAPGDAEPITPRIPHQVVPAAAVPPADEITVHRSRPSTRSAPPPPPEAAASGAVLDAPYPALSWELGPEAESTAAATPGAARSGRVVPARIASPSGPMGAPATEDALLRSLLQGDAPSEPVACDLTRSALGGTGSPLDAMLAGLGGDPHEMPQRALRGSPPAEAAAQVELTPVSGTAPLAPPPRPPGISEGPEEIEAPEYVDDELQDAVVEGDAESAPPVALQAVTAPLGPDMMNRVESHGPAPIPLPERRGMLVNEETTSPALRAYTPPSAGGRMVLWLLILVLALALSAAVYAIVAR